MRKKIAVIGSFGYGISGLDGQTIKTRNVFDLVRKKAPDIKLKEVDSLRIKKQIGYAISSFWRIVGSHEVILLPAENSLAFFFPICYILSLIFRFQIVLICIGGWQYEFFVGDMERYKHGLSLRLCRKIKCFMPEIKTVDDLLISKLGFRNTRVFPNFRIAGDSVYSKNDPDSPLRCAFVARINKMKGYHNVMKAASICEESNTRIEVVFYGSVDVSDREDFYSHLQDVGTVSYGGEIEPQDVNKTLALYDVVLLPTHYYTEGFPGTVLEAYMSGVPVIVSDWKYSHEFVINGKTGIIVPFDDDGSQLAIAIQKLNADRYLLEQMKLCARVQAQKYSEDFAWSILQEVI